MTIAAWFRSDDDTITGVICAVGDKDITDEFCLIEASGAVAGDPVSASYTGSGAPSTASTSTGFTAGTWHHAAGVFLSTASRTAYIDGGSAVTETTAETALATVDSITVGVRPNATTNPFSGDIAEVGVWDVDLTAAEILSLSKGVSPLLIRPASLVFYAPMFGNADPEPDLIEGRSLTNTSTTKSAHPRVLYPSRPMISMTPAAAPPAGVVGPLIGGRLINNSMLVGGRLVGR